MKHISVFSALNATKAPQQIAAILRGAPFKCAWTFQMHSFTTTYVLSKLLSEFPPGESPSSDHPCLSSNCYQCCYFSLRCPPCHLCLCSNCRFNVTHTCHLRVVGDSHTADVIVGCRRHLPSTSCAVTGEEEKRKKTWENLHELAYICKGY